MITVKLNGSVIYRGNNFSYATRIASKLKILITGEFDALNSVQKR